MTSKWPPDGVEVKEEKDEVQEEVGHDEDEDFVIDDSEEDESYQSRRPRKRRKCTLKTRKKKKVVKKKGEKCLCGYGPVLKFPSVLSYVFYCSIYEMINFLWGRKWHFVTLDFQLNV